jgi:hypothetical protein
VRDISLSLVANTHLKHLSISSYNLREQSAETIEKLLCDVSSIESLSNSNHTLESIPLVGHVKLSTLTKKCLELNENENKAKVTRAKILWFYFVGKLDVSPFVKMPLSVMAEVISQIERSGK